MGRSWAGERKKGKVSGLEARCAAGKREQERAGGRGGAAVTSKGGEGTAVREGRFPCATQNTRGQAQQGSLASAPLPQDGFVPENVAWSGPKFLLRVY